MEMTHFSLSLSSLNSGNVSIFHKGASSRGWFRQAGPMGAKKRLGGADSRREGGTRQRGHHKVLLRLGRGTDRDKAGIF